MTATARWDNTRVQEIPRTQGTSAIGSDAKKVSGHERELTEKRLQSISIGGPLLSGITSVLDAAREASVDDWDGDGGRKVLRGSLVYAMDFLQDLPPDYHVPSVAVDPDGELCLEWVRARGWAVSISIGERGQLTFAARFGEDRLKGRESYFGNGLPESVRSALRRLFA